MGILCEKADVEAIYGATIAADLDALIALVSGRIEGEVGRILAADAAIALTLDGPPRSVNIRLPYWPLASVADLTENGVTLVESDDFRASLDEGIIYRRSDGWPTYWLAGVDYITLEVELAPPPDLVALCASVVLRTHLAQRGAAAALDNDMEGLRQLTVGRWSATTDTVLANPSAAMELNELELALCYAWADRKP